MAFRQLRLYGDAILKKRAKPVNNISDNILVLLDDMLETMRHYDGVGLAAPQVGSLRRVVLLEFEENTYEMINPVIIESTGLQTNDEACLSIPGMVGTVERPEKVVIEYTDREGGACILELEDTLAIAVCHEIDHLDGVLYVEKALPDTFRKAEEKNEDGNGNENKNESGPEEENN